MQICIYMYMCVRNSAPNTHDTCDVAWHNICLCGFPYDCLRIFRFSKNGKSPSPNIPKCRTRVSKKPYKPPARLRANCPPARLPPPTPARPHTTG